MSLKRIKKEVQHWDAVESLENVLHNHMDTVLCEKPHWEILDKVDDEFERIVVLRPSCGPYQGLRLGWRLLFTRRRYPFDAPELKPLGRLVDWDDIYDGMGVTLFLPADQDVAGGERCSGTLQLRDDERGEQLVSLRVAGPGGAATAGDFEEDEEEEGEYDAAATAASDPGLQQLGGSEPCEIAISYDWWRTGAHAVLKEAKFFHPFMSEQGALCMCGLRDRWSPSLHFATELAHVRKAVEDAAPEESKEVHGRPQCFCLTNPAAAQAYTQNRDKWFVKAQAMIGVRMAALNLTAVQVDDRLCIESRNIAGELVARFEGLDRDASAAELDMLLGQLPPPEGAGGWLAVLPCGACSSQPWPRATLGKLFSAAGPPEVET